MTNIIDKFRLDGKVAVVTGGAKGLGREHVFTLANAGADVAFCDLLEDVGKETLAEVAKTGRKVYFQKVNVRDSGEIEDFLENVKKNLGVPDILVNNAARPSEGVALETVSDDLWREIIDTNLSSMFYFGKRVAKMMMEAGKGGSIINIASINAFVISNIFPRHNVTYCVAKAAIAQLTKGFACEWAKYNIRANAIAPGYIMTDQTKATAAISEAYERNLNMTPMHRYGEIDELAGALVYLASDASTFTTGTPLLVDGGYTSW